MSAAAVSCRCVVQKLLLITYKRDGVGGMGQLAPRFNSAHF